MGSTHLKKKYTCKQNETSAKKSCNIYHNSSKQSEMHYAIASKLENHNGINNEIAIQSQEILIKSCDI